MNLSKEIILGLGFGEIKVNGFDMYVYCDNSVGALYLEKASKDKEFYMLYKKDENSEELNECGHCKDLSSLLISMMKINHIDSMKLGKELKQQEIKSVLGL